MTPEERSEELCRGLWITPSRIIMERFAEAIRAAVAEEREACAMIAFHHPQPDTAGLRSRIAAAIRARGETAADARESIDE